MLKKITDDDLSGLVSYHSQILRCPKDALDAYRKKMKEKSVPYEEYLLDGQIVFILPKTYRPHAWKLPEIDG